MKKTTGFACSPRSLGWGHSRSKGPPQKNTAPTFGKWGCRSCRLYSLTKSQHMLDAWASMFNAASVTPCSMLFTGFKGYISLPRVSVTIWVSVHKGAPLPKGGLLLGFFIFLFHLLFNQVGQLNNFSFTTATWPR
jgi:hypothetical protein